MREFGTLLDEIFIGLERVSRAEIHRRAVAEDAPAGVIAALDKLPEGEYTQDEVLEAIDVIDAEPGRGVPAGDLTDDDLLGPGAGPARCAAGGAGGGVSAPLPGPRGRPRPPPLGRPRPLTGHRGEGKSRRGKVVPPQVSCCRQPSPVRFRCRPSRPSPAPRPATSSPAGGMRSAGDLPGLGGRRRARPGGAGVAGAGHLAQRSPAGAPRGFGAGRGAARPAVIGRHPCRHGRTVSGRRGGGTGC